MQPSTMLLTGSIGAVFILLALYADIFAFERKAYLVLWFVGWTVIGLNYVVDAFFPSLLRGNRLVFMISTGSFFYANFLIFYGNYKFLGIKFNQPLFIGGSVAWLAGLFALSWIWSDLALITYANSAIFYMTLRTGIALIRVSKRQRGLAFFLGIINIAWVFGAILFSYVLQINQIAFYIIMQAMRFIDAIGLIQMCFSMQKGRIEHGLQYIQHLSEHDELTGLKNKSYYDAKIRELDQDADNLPISLIVGDMNGLKFINDVFGHQEGDNWIKKGALLLKETCRKDDVIARWGGDEFAVILLGTARDEAAAILLRIREACAAERDAEIPVSISLGLATKTGMEESLNDVLQAAEKSMYERKLVEGRKARVAIIQTIEARMVQKGYETQEHLEALQNLAAAFARALNLPADSQADLQMAVKYRDIGKIALPVELVRREEGLEAHEWVVLKKHVEIGYRIVSALSERSPVADAILNQHECWNGQGFPQGLKGEEIPFMARILAILRAFDALTGRRPAAAGEEANLALKTLRQSAGVKFDPDLTAQFIGMMEGETMPGVEPEQDLCLL